MHPAPGFQKALSLAIRQGWPTPPGLALFFGRKTKIHTFFRLHPNAPKTHLSSRLASSASSPPAVLVVSGSLVLKPQQLHVAPIKGNNAYSSHCWWSTVVVVVPASASSSSPSSPSSSPSSPPSLLVGVPLPPAPGTPSPASASPSAPPWPVADLPRHVHGRRATRATPAGSPTPRPRWPSSPTPSPLSLFLLFSPFLSVLFLAREEQERTAEEEGGSRVLATFLVRGLGARLSWCAATIMEGGLIREPVSLWCIVPLNISLSSCFW